jgi:hypothetical protein
MIFNFGRIFRLKWKSMIFKFYGFLGRNGKSMIFKILWIFRQKWNPMIFKKFIDLFRLK